MGKKNLMTMLKQLIAFMALFSAVVISTLVITSADTLLYASQINNTFSHRIIRVYSAQKNMEGEPESIKQSGEFHLPTAIAVNKTGTLAWITNSVANTVSVCQINSKGFFQSCKSIKDNSFKGPKNIILNQAGTQAWVVNYISNTIVSCHVSTSGALSSCSDSGAKGLSSPYGLLMNAPQTQAWITNPGNNSIVFCLVNPTTGHFSSCKNTQAVGLNIPYGITINQNNTIVWSANYGDNSVSFCKVGKGSQLGKLVNCMNMEGLGLSGPIGITLNPASRLVWISNFKNSQITRCTANQQDGLLFDCKKSAAEGLKNPYGVLLSPDNTLAWVADYNNNSIKRCLVDSHWSLSSCIDANHLVEFMPGNRDDTTLQPGSKGTLTIVNYGVDLSSFKLTIPSEHSDWFSKEGTTCPTDTPAPFPAKSSCTLAYSIPDKETISTANILVSNNKEALPELSVIVSTVSASTNGKTITEMTLYHNQEGAITLSSSLPVDNISVVFSNPQLQHYFQGSCLNKTAFSANDSCTLKYTIDDVSNMKGEIKFQQKGQTIYSLPITIRSIEAYRVAFLNDGKTQPFMHLLTGSSGVLTISNTGQTMSSFRMNIPENGSKFFLVGGTCPIKKDTPISFAAGAYCTLPYSIPATASEMDMSISLQNNGKAISSSLSLETSPLSVIRDKKPVSNITLHRYEKNTITLHTPVTIDNLSIHFANNTLRQYFSGSCLSDQQLVAGQSCSLGYSNNTIANLTSHIDIESDGKTIFHLLVHVTPDSTIRIVRSGDIYRYNSVMIYLKNQSESYLTHVSIKPDLSGFKLLSSSCDNIPSNGQCIQKYIVLTQPKDHSVSLKISADQLIPLSTSPTTVNPVPVYPLTLTNHGGYILKAYYPSLSSYDGSIVKSNSGNINASKSKTVYVAIFNDIKDLPGQLTPIKDIELKPLSAAYTRHLPLPNKTNQQIICSRATVNAHCYYSH